MQAHRLIDVLEDWLSRQRGYAPKYRQDIKKMGNDAVMLGAAQNLLPVITTKKDRENFQRDMIDMARVIAIQDAVRSAVKFELPPPPSDKETREEVAATVVLLKEHGLLRLPYPSCYVEYVIDGSIAPDNGMGTPQEVAFRYALLLSDPGPNKPDQVYCISMCSPLMPGVKGWDLPVISKQGRDIWDMKGRMYATADNLSTFKNIQTEGLYWFLFLLSVKAISRVEYAKPEKLNKSRLASRKEPIDSYTKVLLPNWRDTAKKETRGEVEERKRVRLHWRRGHMRNQPYGQRGAGLHRPVFIEPVMVGYEEEGRVYHLQYGQELTA